jgi:hypothetical protein
LIFILDINRVIDLLIKLHVIDTVVLLRLLFL